MNKNKVLVIVSIVLGVLLIAAVIFLILQDRNLNKKADELATSTTATVSSSPSTTATKTKTTTVTTASTSTVATKSDNELIGNALALKLSQPLDNLTYSVSKKSDNAAFGSVTITDEMGGGFFVAVRDGSTWKIIANGNGTIECSVLDENNVPASVVGDCYDSASDESKTR